MENNRQNVLNELIGILDNLAYVKSDEIPEFDMQRTFLPRFIENVR